MPPETISKDLFLEKNKMIRLNVPPVRIGIITEASGVEFNECYTKRQMIDLDGISVNFISFEDLKINKQAAGRYKDLEDLEHLP